jgi:hypothetical protein
MRLVGVFLLEWCSCSFVMSRNWELAPRPRPRALLYGLFLASAVRSNKERRGNLQSWPRGKRRPRFCGVLCCLDDRSTHTQRSNSASTWVDGKHRGRRCSQGSHVEEEKGYAHRHRVFTFSFLLPVHGIASHYHRNG